MSPAFLPPSPTRPRTFPHVHHSQTCCINDEKRFSTNAGRKASALRMVTEERQGVKHGTLRSFKEFMERMPGTWNSERTYHYVNSGEGQKREESQSTFEVRSLGDVEVEGVLRANGVGGGVGLGREGFRVSFLTRMESEKELVRAGTNLVFVVEEEREGVLRGGYYRDEGYEERGSRRARFEFGGMELSMETVYERVISVDEIRLTREGVRLRRIVNYRREGLDKGDVVLVGYGVEMKGGGRLVV